MKKTISLLLLVLGMASLACKKETNNSGDTRPATNSVTGKITDAGGRPLAGGR